MSKTIVSSSPWINQTYPLFEKVPLAESVGAVASEHFVFKSVANSRTVFWSPDDLAGRFSTRLSAFDSVDHEASSFVKTR